VLHCSRSDLLISGITGRSGFHETAIALMRIQFTDSPSSDSPIQTRTIDRLPVFWTMGLTWRKIRKKVGQSFPVSTRQGKADIAILTYSRVAEQMAEQSDGWSRPASGVTRQEVLASQQNKIKACKLGLSRLNSV